jgi:pre-mRNA-splicing factor ATP-dependent RNA helicase DHX15/PRP43
MERKRKVSLFDVKDDISISSKLARSNGSSMPGVNSWTGRPYSSRYYEILEKRKSLPVWQQKEDFLRILKNNQTLVLVGETGSGKTTQVDFSFSESLVQIRCYC